MYTFTLVDLPWLGFTAGYSAPFLLSTWNLSCRSQSQSSLWIFVTLQNTLALTLYGKT